MKTGPFCCLRSQALKIMPANWIELDRITTHKRVLIISISGRVVPIPILMAPSVFYLNMPVRGVIFKAVSMAMNLNYAELTGKSIPENLMGEKVAKPVWENGYVTK